MLFVDEDACNHLNLTTLGNAEERPKHISRFEQKIVINSQIICLDNLATIDYTKKKLIYFLFVLTNC